MRHRLVTLPITSWLRRATSRSSITVENEIALCGHRNGLPAPTENCVAWKEITDDQMTHLVGEQIWQEEKGANEMQVRPDEVHIIISDEWWESRWIRAENKRVNGIADSEGWFRNQRWPHSLEIENAAVYVLTELYVSWSYCMKFGATPRQRLRVETYDKKRGHQWMRSDNWKASCFRPARYTYVSLRLSM